MSSKLKSVWLRWRGFFIGLVGLFFIALPYFLLTTAPQPWRITSFLVGWVIIIVGFIDFIGLSKKAREMYLREDDARREKFKSKQPWE